MAEIKNNFLQGKMNKDLDERIIPKGQYRDAMNIQITSSDEDDAGTVQNILGNSSVESIASISSSCRCVGSIANPLTNRIYWFVKCSDRSAIVEYNEETDNSKFIIVESHSDLKPLNFTGKQITGINIIDDFLFWTDGDNEPKKINLKNRYIGLNYTDQDFSQHSHLVLDNIDYGDLKEEHITVIKKKPLRAPYIQVESSKDNPTESIFKKEIPRFCVRYKYNDGEVSAFGPFTAPVFNPAYVDDFNQYNFYNSTESYNTAMLNYIKSITIKGFVDNSTPKDVVEVEILYKNENSNVVYSIAKIKKTDAAWSAAGNLAEQYDLVGINSETTGSYTLSSENIYVAIAEDQLLRPWDNVPKKALAQEVTGNRIVYGNYTQGYDVDNVSLSAYYDKRLKNLYNSSATGFLNYPVKPHKTIKSQRNYQIGVLFGDKYCRETPILTEPSGGFYVDWKSYKDGSYNAATSNMINAALLSDIPSWAYYYKFYVKETSGDYYNLLNERTYIPFVHSQFENEDDHVYLSFPSADRNKIKEDDYIILKTVLQGSVQQVTQENKYKVLDISNEAPEAIAYKFYNLGTFENSTEILHNDIFTSNPVNGDDQRIDKLTQTIRISKAQWQAVGNDGSALTNSEGGGNETSNDIKNLYATWKDNATGQSSTRYKITNIRVEDNNIYVVRLSEAISEQDANLASETGNYLDVNAHLNQHLQFTIQRRDRFSNENFSGSFFVKIAADDLIKEKLIVSAQNITPEDSVLNTEELFLWADKAADGYSSDRIVNNQNSTDITNYYYEGTPDTPDDIHGAGSISNTKAAWDDLLSSNIGYGSGKGKFFIDAMYMAACQPDQNSKVAREAGQGWAGPDHVRYPRLVWTNQNVQGPGGTTATQHNWINSINPFNPTLPAPYDPFDLQLSVIDMNANWGWVVENYLDYTLGNNAYLIYNTTNYDQVQTLDTSAMSAAPTAHTYMMSSQTSALGQSGIYVNGLEGIIEPDFSHYDPSPSGYRKWSESTIYGTERNIGDNTYDASAEAYMHVSFLGPGEDLFKQSEATNIPATIKIRGLGGLGKYLQGIWGGGAFTKMQNVGSTIIDSDLNSNSTDLHFIEMEGHYFTSMPSLNVNLPNNSIQIGAPGAPGPDPSGNVSSSPGQPHIFFDFAGGGGTTTKVVGYDSYYTDRHENQWNPLHQAGSDTQSIQTVDNGLSVGSEFRFGNDPNSEVYTILGKKVKYIYNHTPWRARMQWNGTASEYQYGGDSVEEAVVAWAETHADDDSISTQNSAGTGYNTEFQNVLDKLEAFGSRSNRRVCYVLELNKNPKNQAYNPLQLDDGTFDVDTASNIEFVSQSAQSFSSEVSSRKSIFETEPKKSADLDIYYETSSAYPTELTEETNELFAPVGSRVEFVDFPEATDGHEKSSIQGRYISNWFNNGFGIRMHSQSEEGFNHFNPDGSGNVLDYVGKQIRIYRPDGGFVSAIIESANQTNPYYIDPTGGGYGAFGNQNGFSVKLDHTLPHGLDYFNAFEFNNGIESDTIRDDFNEVSITTGARASTTLDEPYSEETRKYGLIFSGIYNSNTGINNLNQFIQAQKITKDLNPTYGSIQKLFQRQTNLVVFCEDRVVKVLANKDAIFNADGNPQLVANENVLGQTTPFVGDYGIGKNPESFAKESYRAYFTDKQKRAVLRLSMDGLTPISDAGMKDWFRDNLTEPQCLLLGTYDENKKEYNLTIKESISNNIITNAYFEDGEPLVETTLNPEIVLNGSITGATDFTPVNFQNDILGDPVLDPVTNPSLDQTVTIKNWPAIAEGSIIPELNPTTFQQQGQAATASVFTFLPSGAPWPNNYGGGNVYHMFYDNLNTATAIFTASSTSGFPDATYGFDVTPPSLSNYQTFGNSQPWLHASFNSGNNVYAPPNNMLPNTTQSSQNINDGVVFWMPSNTDIDNYAVPLGTGVSGLADTIATAIKKGISTTQASVLYPYSINNTSPSHYHANTALDVGNWTTDQGNINGVDYSNVNTMTVFNGEEVRVRFHVLSNSSFQNTGTNGARSGFKIELYDGSTLIDDSKVHVPSGGSLPYGDIALASGASAGGNGSNTRGFQDSTSVDFTVKDNGNAFWADWSVRTSNYLGFQAFFKFTDGTTNEGIVVNNLKIKLTRITEDVTGGGASIVNPPHSLVIDEIRVTKYYRLETPEKPQIDPINQQPAVPDQDIPAWAEVIHNNPVNWNADTEINITRGCEDEFGSENPGTAVAIVNNNNVTIPSPYTTTSYYTGTSNGVIAYQNAGSNETDATYGQPYRLEQDLPVSNTKVEMTATPNSSAALWQANNAGYVAGNWYLVEVEYDPNLPENAGISDMSQYKPFLYTTGVLDATQDNLECKQNSISHLDNDPRYPDYHFGTPVGGPSITNHSMKLMPAIRTTHGSSENILMAIFKSFVDTTKFEIKAWQGASNSINDTIIIKNARVFDITATATMSEPANWNTPDANYETPHAVYQIVQPFFPDASPQVYIDDSLLTFNTTTASNKYWAQGSSNPTLGTITDSFAGYNLEFEVFPNPDTGTVEESLNVRLGNTIGESGIPNEYTGLALTNIDTAGVYKINYNYLQTYTPVILEQPAGSNVQANSIENSIYSGFNTGHDSMLFFGASNNGFVGAVGNISIKNATSTFSGGGVDSWTFGGFDPSFQDFAYFDNGQLTFDNAENGTYAAQNIGNIINNTTWNISFNYSGAEGQMLIYYINSAGQGFAIPFIGGFNSSSGTFNETIIIDHVDQSSIDFGGSPLTDTFVIVCVDTFVDATIDDISFNQTVGPNFVPRTLTYKEDVKGWISFKSFVPENGLSLGSNYYTMKQGGLWKHHSNNVRNQFYGQTKMSTISFIFNDSSATVKNFQTITYEGSKGRRMAYSVNPENTNINTVDESTAFLGIQNGWYVSSINTNIQKGSINEFIKKEGKYYNYIKGALIDTDSSEDVGSLNFQGLGIISQVAPTLDELENLD